MKKPIFQSENPVTLIGAGRVLGPSLRAARGLAPEIVAADGGAEAALAAGAMPDAVIGDLDSLSARAREAIPAARQHRITEQDSTDFDKALRHIGAPLVIGVGFDGDRVDHVLASFNTLIRRADRRCILLTDKQLVLVCPPQITLDLTPGCLVSLFPMGAVAGRSEGLVWPIQGLNFAPDGRVGTSNRAAEGGAVRLWMDAPRMLVILPQDQLPQVARAVIAAPGWAAVPD